MANKKRNRKVNRNNGGLFQKIFANTGNPEDIEDQDWYLDSPDIRLTRVFSVVLVLHIIAVGGILAFKMIDKATDPGSMSITKAKIAPREAPPIEKEFAAKVTPQPVKVSVPAAAPETRDDRYEVKRGDTLSGIAAKLGVTTEQMKVTNHINSPDEILPGMWLKVPVEVAYDNFDDHPVKVTTSEYVSSEVMYQIQKGDTAWSISQKHGIDLSLLLNHNGISDPTKLQVGQLLEIPGQ